MVIDRSWKASRWHYTCDHGAAAIRGEGVVRPNLHPLLGVPVAWFTDLGHAYRRELGLTSDTLKCDRMAYRFEAAHSEMLQWWPRAARSLKVPAAVRDELEYGRLPAHWWVSLAPVEVVEVAACADMRERG